MKKLLKKLSPLAPDDSGACSVLYELGGITVICDAGGCTGNVCGFDEPRWHEKKSALFSAGLREMDAILGRDDRLVAKLEKVCQQVDAEFTAIIGTPVPAVIATDYHALTRMCEKKTGLPCITIETDGTKLYDKGEALAYSKLFRRFAAEQFPVVPGRLGVLGATPLNTGLTRADRIRAALSAQGWKEIICFGLDSGLADIRSASSCEKILVIAPSGIQAAEYLRETFGIPYETGFPILPEQTVKAAQELENQRVLIMHQQYAANALRQQITGCQTDVATWFTLDRDSAQPQDFHIRGEEELLETVKERQYDVIIADSGFDRLLRGTPARRIPFPHYAVSAELI